MAEKEYRQGSHTVYDIKYHLVWVTKYRYKVLTGEVAFFYHPTFQVPYERIRVSDGVARVRLYAYGAFTVGALAEDGTELELDLASLESAPRAFRDA